MELLLSYNFGMENKSQKKLCENIYNTVVVLDKYCQYNADCEEIQYISPIIEFLRKESDRLCAEIFDFE